MDLQKPIEWQQIKVGWLGFQGDQLLCIVEKMEDLPVEGWVPNILQDTYVTPEGAMACAKRILARIQKHEDEHDAPRVNPFLPYLPILKALVLSLEPGAKISLVVERSQPETQPKAE